MFDFPIGTNREPAIITGGSIEVVNIPKYAQWIQIVGQGPGAGGGGGASADATANRGGGAGGMAGLMHNILIAAKFLPSTLYVFPGLGGAGGAAGTAGSNGNLQYVLVQPSANNPLHMVFGVLNAAGGGGAGTATAGGAVGSTSTSRGVSIFARLGFYNSTTSSSASAGGLGNAGGANNLDGQLSLAFGGTGGGGHTSAPANLNGGAIGNFTGYVNGIPSLPAGVAGGGNGSNGVFLKDKWFSLPGTGGGSNFGATGGNGGDGIMGSGGGGGGSGLTGGAGGKGGDGYVAIWWW